MLPRTRIIVALAAIASILAVSGCEILLLSDEPASGEPGRGEPAELDDPIIDPELLTVAQPAGESVAAGDTLAIRWTGTDQPSVLDIDLYVAGVPDTRLAEDLANSGAFSWTIPLDFRVKADVLDEYQIVVSGFHPDQRTGALLLAAYSVEFAILPRATGGLSDVTVSRRLVDVTLTDNGQEIDGDTVDLYLNGEAVELAHVLAGGAGTTFPLTLQAGENVLEIYAVNEGTTSPNTALLEISHVSEGLTAQEWRLWTGEVGRLTITAP